MSETVISVENLGKKYIIGHQMQGQYVTLKDKLTNGAKFLGRKLFRYSTNSNLDYTQEEFWALKDVSFEIKQGDRIGIIGRNGAGKSTLLKILSRITEPTTGEVSIQGRVASLLEVGTGFHPELTGRENIYLNGAILGMSKVEIKSKFDEIVDFAEVERFLDTPVKRYSSGMYVRLAFAVAAHLEPEILIVDEVLAVGDIQFQKKCLGKMQDVSKSQGRTVLFVSHNMEAIQRLCSQCLMFERGQLVAQTDAASAIQRYISNNFYQSSPNSWVDVSDLIRTGTGEARFVKIQYSSLNESVGFQPYSNGTLEFLLEIESDLSRQVGSLAVVIYNKSGNKLVNADTLSIGQVISLQKGHNIVRLRIKQLHLNPDIYVLGFWLADPLGGEVFDFIEYGCEFEVVNIDAEGFGMRPPFDGCVTCDFEILSVN
ncbi:MAG TPA: teichoic-acid-transporting ATPase [Cyanobacteria bacterium UBA11372]|nr:teichoic-acid-transporting ATPase [Cyanobacteria bacterium UBA11372]